MTIDNDARIRLPRWTIELLVLLSVAGVTFTATHFLDNLAWKVGIEDRVTALEKVITPIVAEQKINSEARIRQQQELDDIKAVVDKNNELLQEHMSETSRQR